VDPLRILVVIWDNDKIGRRKPSRFGSLSERLSGSIDCIDK
jgi:hypothetical protein